MKIKKIIMLVFVFGTNIIFCQNVYYKLDDKPLMNENYFEAIKKTYAKIGDFKMEIISTQTRKDSIIKTVAFKMIKLKNNKSFASPYAKHEAKIGQHFPIEKFYESENTMFSKTFLKGKPTIVNFWFTRCPPCIEEIPILNQLKKDFGETVNFVAITFDSKEIVDAFLVKKNIDFRHITDSRKQLDDLEVQAYPMNLILNKNGNIVEVTGQFSSKKDIVEKLKKIATDR